MNKLQEDILSKANLDGGYPKPVIMFPGIIVLAKDKEEYERLRKQDEIGVVGFIVGMLLLMISFLVFTVFN